MLYKFICYIDVADEMRGLQLPKLCIQPLVENAVKYALENDEEVCNVYIKTFKDRGCCYLSVSNTGSKFPKEVMEKIKNSEKIGDGLSIGLNNINKRLKLLYGDEYGIKLFNSEDMATVVIMIPGETHA